MQQYYLITITSPAYFLEDKKIIVNSIKELKQFIQNEVQDLKYQFPELNKILKKRSEIQNMYVDTRSGKTKIVGKVFSFGKKGKLSDQEIEDFLDTSYISFWCQRVSKKDLSEFSGFKEVEQ